MPDRASHLPGPLASLLDEDLEDLYHHAPAGYLSTLADGTIVKVNDTFLRWTGFARGELVSQRRFQDLFSTPGRIYYETHLGPLLALQGAVNEIAVDIVRADGRSMPAMINAAQKTSAGGAAVLTRYTVFNATDRRRYEQELLQARREAEAVSRAKTELLAMLSHDIRTPLGSIMAVAQLLERSSLSAEQEPLVRILRRSSSAMLALVNQVLEAAKIEAGAVSLDPAPFDLGRLVTELVENLQPIAREKGIALSAHIDPVFPPAVIGDATKLGQVLGNLVGNALKFTEKGSVSVKLVAAEISPTEVKATVCVADTGIGIQRDELPRIFREFTQANDAIAGRYGGSGLGLAISRKLLRAHGSEIHVDSEVGKGSQFRFDVKLGLAPPRP